MRRLFFTLSLSLLLLLLAAADLSAKQRIRIFISDPAVAKELPRGLDVVGRGPGYIDVIADQATLSSIGRAPVQTVVLDVDVEAKLQSLAADYHTFPEMVSELQSIASSYPAITDLTVIGQSYQGEDIYCLEVSDNPGVDEGEVEVLFIGLHHAREWPSLEICLHVCNEMTSGYGSDPDITDMVDNRRLFVVPCMNPDGYIYCHDQGHDWRKNRHYFSQYGTWGVDLNRNYGGSSNGAPTGDWGDISSGGTTHYPDYETYCGPSAISEPETQAICDFIKARSITAGITWHTYSELVLWPWGYSGSQQTPDNALLASIGQNMASRISKQSGGTYTPYQSSGLYPTTGDTTDWAYGHSFYVEGKNTFFYTIEACNQFHPNYNQMQQVMEENFDGAFYLLQQAETIRTNTTPWPLPPAIDAPATDDDGDFYVDWTEINPAAGVDYFQLDELSDLVIVTEDVESGSSLWDLSNFSVSTSRSYSATHSFKSHNSNNRTGTATTKYPLPVSTGDTLTFWTWYDIESNWDHGIVEVSVDGKKWDDLALFTGSSSGWKEKNYSLDAYAGQSILIRFTYTTDANTLEEGFYVDDIEFVPDFGTVTTLSSSIYGHSYHVTGKPDGDYYYRVKGHSPVHGWADFSVLDKTVVDSGGGPSLDVTISPYSTVVPRGGTLRYDVDVVNNGGSAVSAVAWTDVYMNGSGIPMNPLFGPYSFTAQPGQPVGGTLSHAIPPTAPLGNIYELFFITGVYPSTSYGEDSFTFEVTP